MSQLRPVNIAISDAAVARLRAHPHETSADLANELGVPYHRLYPQLRRLERAGIIGRVCDWGGVRWFVRAPVVEVPPLIVTWPHDTR